MRLKGEYVMREVVGETLLIPVGETALAFNGMITLDPVSALIWKELEDEASQETILEQILSTFDVAQEVASQDLEEFLNQLEAAGLLER